MVASIKERISLDALDSMFDDSSQPMDRYTDDSSQLRRITPATHSNFSDLYRALASRGTMGGSVHGNPHIYMGMGVVLCRRNQHQTPDANQFDHPATTDPIHRTILGALVGSKTQEVIGGGA